MRRFNEIKLIERRNFNERINSIATNLFAARRRAHEGADYNYLPTPSPTYETRHYLDEPSDRDSNENSTLGSVYSRASVNGTSRGELLLWKLVKF